MDIKVGRKAIEEASKKLSNWGRWGKDDHVGTLNHVTPEDIAGAASLIKTGKVFALGIPLDREGPQNGRVVARKADLDGSRDRLTVLELADVDPRTGDP